MAKIIVIWITLGCFIVWRGATGAQDRIALEAESVTVSSEMFAVQVSVVGLSAEPWIPAAAFRVRWNPDDVSYLFVDQDDSIREAHQLLFSNVGESDLIILISTCEGDCGIPILPLSTQPLVRLTFNVMRSFQETTIELDPRLQFNGRTVVWINPGGTPVEPVLVNGKVAVTEFIRGDVDGDQHVDIGDAIRILQFLFELGPVDCEDPADANDDGRVDIGDAVFVLFYKFGGGKAPSYPFAEKGLDPTDDDLGCGG